MIATLVLLALQATQNKPTVYRTDENKASYDRAVEACKEAEKLLGTSPEASIEKLAPVFADVEKGRLTYLEQDIVIEVKSLEYKDHELYPFHLRGKARLLAGRKLKGEESRRLLIDAANDLQASLARKADRSRAPLAEAITALWENVRVTLAYEGWTSGRTELVPPALALLASSDLAKETADWLGKEFRTVDDFLRGLRKTVADLDARRTPARLAAEWCEAVGAAVQGIPAYETVQAAAGKTGALAASIRDSRGAFRLKIGVSPYARVERLARSGEEIALADRDTPAFIPQDLEIGDYTVELVHQNFRKTATISAKSLEPGRTYVLWGDMSRDEFKVAELPRK